MSHLTRGAWIEILAGINIYPTVDMSHLTRGAWIEIRLFFYLDQLCAASHLTRGAWIEILRSSSLNMKRFCRTSHEVRGLKLSLM